MIKFLIMDVDGTLTDGKIYFYDNFEMKAFNIKDGFGIKNILPKFDITPIVITGRYSSLVNKRCNELDIKEIIQNATDKSEILHSLQNRFSFKFSEVAYIGDDLNDYGCMTMIKENGGLVGCPNDATKEIRKISNFISKFNGGEGAVRDFIEYITSI